MADADGTKSCRDCGARKALALFDKNSRNKDGYCGQCKDCRKAYYRANAERYKARAKNWREADPDRAKLKDKLQREQSPKARAAANQRWRDANREHLRAYNREYVRGNLDYFRAKNAARRVRVGASDEHYTPEDIQDLFRLQRGCCAACRQKLFRFDVDHVQALSKGGSNARLNIQLLCPPCNRRKHDKDSIEFMQGRGFLL